MQYNAGMKGVKVYSILVLLCVVSLPARSEDITDASWYHWCLKEGREVKDCHLQATAFRELLHTELRVFGMVDMSRLSPEEEQKLVRSNRRTECLIVCFQKDFTPECTGKCDNPQE